MSSSDHLSEDLNSVANWRSSLTLVTFLIARGWHLVRILVPINLNTAPLIAVVFLLLTTAIGSEELREGTLGANNIVPVDIVLFALTVGYIARSIDASGLIRYLAYKVVTSTTSGSRLFLCLYFFFFAIGALFGCDPVIQIGALFLTYLTRMSSNIKHPRAWIYTPFAVANMASTIFVSSNTTNVVIAQAFKISFARYAASVFMPVIVTTVLLFPLLLYVIFNNVGLIPPEIKINALVEERRARMPFHPHITSATDQEDTTDLEEQIRPLELERLMNPFLDKSAATIGVSLMLTSLAILMVLTALGYNDIQVFWVTLPASFVMFCWDTAVGWSHRHETREIARKSMGKIQHIKREAVWRQREQMCQHITCCERTSTRQCNVSPFAAMDKNNGAELKKALPAYVTPVDIKSQRYWPHSARHIAILKARDGDAMVAKSQSDQTLVQNCVLSPLRRSDDNAMAGPSYSSSPHARTSITPETGTRELNLEITQQVTEEPANNTTVRPPPPSMSIRTAVQVRKENPLSRSESILNLPGLWFKQTLPTVAYTSRHIPFSNIPFVLPLFILVQALASTGWVTIMARGWGSWVDKTGVLGSTCGMAFLSMTLCNFAGTNIGAAILCSRIVQDWQALRTQAGEQISERLLWATVYAMAIGVNYGAFSFSFAASLAGIGWRDDLERLHIHIRRMEFARVNVPLIFSSMVISCGVLLGQAHIIWNSEIRRAKNRGRKAKSA